MQAYRIHVNVPKDRRVVIEFPHWVPPGQVELIVLIPAEREETTEKASLEAPGAVGCCRGGDWARDTVVPRVDPRGAPSPAAPAAGSRQGLAPLEPGVPQARA